MDLLLFGSDPDAEVIALSPKTLMATNRFICEVCNKGFQREQNLQLHRRGHNLPWKLKQKSTKDPKRKVYLCPEPTCVHHHPSRALGDLTGIKKHYSRKHGEKKWKCDKCSKRYAVQSDWKAHSKTCGTREYRCDCGTLFSRSPLLRLLRFIDFQSVNDGPTVVVVVVVVVVVFADGIVLLLIELFAMHWLKKVLGILQVLEGIYMELKSIPISLINLLLDILLISFLHPSGRPFGPCRRHRRSS